ncbi:MAG: hypothetical protein ABWZ52_02270 [Acidimicrobiales bacterium]
MTRAAALLTGVVLLLVFGASMAGAAPDGTVDDRRVVVISVPGLTWADLEEADLPNLEGLVADSAVANLATRVTRVVTEPGPAYLTLGTGTRAVAPREVAGLAFDADERFGPGVASEEHARQHGTVVDDDVLSLSWELLVEANAEAEFGGEIGALGESLAAAGVERGVVGNADGADPLVPGEPIHREAALALADRVGAVPCGQVGTSLLTADDAEPFGVRLDETAVLDEVERCSTPGSVVLVEASDLRRAVAFGARAPGPQADAAYARALARTDEMVGELLADTDPERDAVVLVAPTTEPDPGLGVLAIRAEELPPGFLTSGNTRRSGYVLLTDLTPTIAGLVGVDMDEASIEGRTVEAVTTDLDVDERVARLVEGEAAALFRDRMLEPVVFALVSAVGALAVATGIACVRGWDVLRPFLEPIALVLLAFPATTYLAAPLPFHDWGAAAFWAFLVAGSLLFGVIACALRRAWLRPLWLLYGLTVAVVALSVVVLGSRLQIATVFGDSPVIAGRFTGINNVTFAFFFLSGAMLACLAVQTWPGRRGRQVMVAILAGVLLVDVAPMWGADVGGALAGLPALLLIGMGLGEWKVRWRTVAIAVLATLFLIGALAWLDLTRDAADRSHLGRLFERIGSEGSSGLTTVVERKLIVNLRSLTESAWRFVFGPLAIALALVVWRGRARARAVADAFPPLRRALPGLIVLAVLGYGANDSGIAVPAAMLAMAVPGVVYLACRVDRAEGSA